MAEKPLPDFLNPIFVLDERESFSNWWNHPIANLLPFGIVFVAMQVARTLFPEFDLSEYLFSQDFVRGLVIALPLLIAVKDQNHYVDRTVEKDLVHYTSMSRREILFGYFSVGLYRAVLYSLLGIYLIFLAYFPDFFTMARFLPAVLVAAFFGIALKLYHLSWSVAIREPLHHVCVAVAILPSVAALYIPLIIRISDAPLLPALLVAILYGTVISVVSLGMIRLGLSEKVDFPEKFLSCLVGYLVVSFFLWVISGMIVTML